MTQSAGMLPTGEFVTARRSERRFVCLFLRRYVIRCARRRRIAPIRPALELLTEVGERQ
jgi:hypothetical protein